MAAKGNQYSRPVVDSSLSQAFLIFLLQSFPMTLKTLIHAVVSPGSVPGAPPLRTCLQALDAWVATRPAIDRDLLHFLRRRSYGKARDWLDDHPAAPEANRELPVET